MWTNESCLIRIFQWHHITSKALQQSTATATTTATSPALPLQVAVVRAPRHAVVRTPSQKFIPDFDVIDNVSRQSHTRTRPRQVLGSTSTPLLEIRHGHSARSRRGGIVSRPEVIANHVAQRVASLATARGRIHHHGCLLWMWRERHCIWKTRATLTHCMC